MQVTYCRWAPSLGELEGTHQEAWGTETYTANNRNDSTVFFGLYDLRDYIALWRHRGKAWVFWAGSDITNLKNGFVFNDGKLKLISKILRGNKWIFSILKKAEHWVENGVEYEALKALGIESNVCPSFMGKIKDYKIEYRHKYKMNVYVSAAKNRQEEYGFDTVERVAFQCPTITFNLYGADWFTTRKNIVVHGHIPKEKMNEQIKKMQCGLRINEFDGFSEITAKSILWGQYPITRIKSAYIQNFENDKTLIKQLKKIQTKESPNIEARNYYLKALNQYPWCNL